MAKGKSVVSVNFKDVGSGGATRVKPGDYAVKVKKVEVRESNSSGSDYLNWECEGIVGDLKGKKIFHTTSLQAHALFTLRNTLLACKMDVPQSKFQVDLTKLVGKVFGVTIEDDEYKGRVKSAIVDVFPVSIKNGKMVKEAMPTGDEYDSDDEDLPDDIDSEDYSEMDLEELIELCEEREIKLTKKEKKDSDAIIAKLEEWDEEHGDDEESDDDDEEEDDEDEVDLDEMNLEELIAFAKEKKIKLDAKAKKSEAKARKVIEAALEEDDE